MKPPAVSSMIIAYGNPDRRDDGLGWAAAGKLKARGLPPALALKVCRQLTPELAAEIHCLPRLAFVDAAAGGKPGALCVRRVVPGHERQGLGHGIAPPALLALARAAYGRCPEAAVFSVAGAVFDHGRGLTPAVRTALPQLIEALARWIKAEESPDFPPLPRTR